MQIYRETSTPLSGLSVTKEISSGLDKVHDITLTAGGTAPTQWFLVPWYHATDDISKDFVLTTGTDNYNIDSCRLGTSGVQNIKAVWKYTPYPTSADVSTPNGESTSSGEWRIYSPVQAYMSTAINNGYIRMYSIGVDEGVWVQVELNKSITLRYSLTAADTLSAIRIPNVGMWYINPTYTNITLATAFPVASALKVLVWTYNSGIGKWGAYSNNEATAASIATNVAGGSITAATTIAEFTAYWIKRLA